MSRRINAKKFSAVMRKLATVPSQASRKIAEDISKEIQRNFDRGVDPYGRKWKRLSEKYKEASGRTDPPLTASGTGRRGVIVSPTQGAGIRIVVTVLYMIYHQFGGASHLRGPGGSYKHRKKNKHFGRDKDRSPGRRRPPKRSFLPFERMPDAWRAIFLKRIEQAARRVLRG